MMKFKTVAIAAALATTMSVNAFAADAASAKGFYIGGSVGGAITVGKWNVTGSEERDDNDGNLIKDAALAEPLRYNNSATLAATGALFGVFMGYNHQMYSFVMGLNVGFDLDTTKKDVFNSIETGDKAAAYQSKVTLRKKGAFEIAPRFGFMFTPNTLVYVKTGFSYGKWEMEVTPDSDLVNATGDKQPNEDMHGKTEWLEASSKPVTTSKSKFSFAPGFGVEMYRGKVLFRLEYTYVSGPKIPVKQDMRGLDVKYVASSYMNHTKDTSQHQVKVGIGYKF